MSDPTIERTLELALRHHQAGRLAEAGALYGQILARDPGHPDALHLSGVLAGQFGKPRVAVELISRAIQAAPEQAAYYANLSEFLRRIGNVDDAIAAGTQAATLSPDYIEAHNNLGNALKDKGQLGEAIAAYQRALSIDPNFAVGYCNLGSAMRARGQVDDAVTAYRKAIELDPNLVAAYQELAIVYKTQGKRAEAIAMCEKVVELQPRRPEAYNNLGNALAANRQYDEAIASYRRAIQLKPDFAEAHNNLGNVHRAQLRLVDAVAEYRRAVQLRPEYAEAHDNLGTTLREQGRIDEAISVCRKATQVRPDYATGHLNLGNVLRDRGLTEEAIASYRRAIELEPGFVEAHANLGNVLKEQGQLPEAFASYRKAIELDPESAEVHSNLVYSVCFSPDYDARQILAEAQTWSRKHAEPLAERIKPLGNDRDPGRKLRIGYISADFRDHVVGRNVLPVLEHHDRVHFEVHCYSGVRIPDEMTRRFQKAAEKWHPIAGMKDAELAERIRRAGIDILVDLTLHMADGRLKTFARKPAPVQVTWAGYPGTTGLNTIDYRLTDPHLDPPGHGDDLYSEKSFRLPHSFWCYRPREDAPRIGALPATTNRAVTFGCLNNFSKVTEPAIALWTKILQSLPLARLLVLCPGGSSRDRLVQQLRGAGAIARDRIAFVGPMSPAEYLRTFNRIDVSLDTMPYCGHSTSLDSFWMGVPVVTLVGLTSVSRGGVSIAANLGLTELIAHSPEEYVKLAVDLARNLQRIDDYRSTLRQRMRASPLMDLRTFTADLEKAFRQMWKDWCGKKTSQ
jgi:predicted O-linked N-acetylglucosamine transferase (SPINDLY family)